MNNLILNKRILLTLGIFLIICAFIATNAHAQAGGCGEPAGCEGSWVNIFPSGGNYNPNNP